MKISVPPFRMQLDQDLLYLYRKKLTELFILNPKPYFPQIFICQEILEIMKLEKVPLLIVGRFIESRSFEVIDVLNPATQEIVSQIPLTTNEEFEVAVSAAKEAFPSWRNAPITTRQRVMLKLQELIRRDMEKIKSWIT